MTPALARGRSRAFAMLLAGCVPAMAQPVPTLRDDDGRPALMGTPAVRVVTLAPSLAELVFAAGAGDKLAAVSAFSDYPAGVAELPQVADASGVSLESLLAVKPDLVLAWKGGTRQTDINRLHQLGINVFVIEIRTLADVPRALRAIGRLVGRPDPANHAAAVFEAQVTRLRAAHAGKPPVRTFFEISSRPLMTVNRDHVISEIMTLCGGENVFAASPSLVSEPSRESFLNAAPEVVLHGNGARYETGEAAKESMRLYRLLPVGREGRVFGITANFAFRPGPRLLLAADEVCEALDRARISLKRPTKK